MSPRFLILWTPSVDSHAKFPPQKFIAVYSRSYVIKTSLSAVLSFVPSNILLHTEVMNGDYSFSE